MSYLRPLACNLGRRGLPLNKELILLGGGGFAVELASLLEEDNFNIAGIISIERPSASINASWLGGDIVAMKKWSKIPMLMAVGKPLTRAIIYKQIIEAKACMASYIHKSAYVSKNAHISVGAVIYPNATIHSGVYLEDNVFVNSGAVIGHEARICKNTVVSMNASIGGRVNIGSGSYIGFSSCIKEGLSIAGGVKVGGGAVVISDINLQNSTYVGIPARKV